jgi:hypothetical protein
MVKRDREVSRTRVCKRGKYKGNKVNLNKIVTVNAKGGGLIIADAIGERNTVYTPVRISGFGYKLHCK